MNRPTIIPAMERTGSRPADSWLASLGRRVLLARLGSLTQGGLRLRERDREWTFGRQSPACPLACTIDVLDAAFWADTAFGGTVGAGESYIRGTWTCDDLTALVRIIVLNRPVMQDLEGGWALASAPLRRLLHFLNRNSRRGSERNIAAHYDLGNDFFALMLDDTMTYSCGIFERPDATLREASVAKFDEICRRLALAPGDRLLEIGTGWGGFAIHAARQYGCHVTTTTISREQYDWARQRIEAAGLAERIDLRLQDYRDLDGTYDKLVSIEMIEAVGARYLDEYFARCAALLSPSGAMLLQAITLQDQFYEEALRSVDFIQRFVFPGSFIPSVTAILNAATRASDLKLVHLRDIGPHYATTLRCWRDAVAERITEIRALGYPDEFLRLWEFYLCYCEGGFAERQLGDVHMLLAKPGCRLPLAC